MLGKKRRRERMLLEANYACTICGFNKRRPDGGVILEIDYIDGDPTNNDQSNLRVLCPNCHAMTPTFRNWNGSNKKSTKRLLPMNKGYALAMQLVREQREKAIEDFKLVVLETHATGEIDYSKFGWIETLATKLGEISQVVSKRIKNKMPEFYATHCYSTQYRKRTGP